MPSPTGTGRYRTSKTATSDPYAGHASFTGILSAGESPKEAPVERYAGQYEGQQYVGIDLHRRRSVVVRMTAQVTATMKVALRREA